MTHFQDEGHYQEHINAQAQADIEAQMQQEMGEAKAEIDAIEHEKENMARELGVEQPETKIDWEAMENKETLPISFGEKLVGIEFNPSNDDKVAKAKMLCAELANLLHDHYENKESTFLETKLYQHAIGEILNAQMNVVKVLTFKY